MTYKPCHPSSQQKCDKSSLVELTQLLINCPVAVPSTCYIFQEFVEDSDMSDALIVLLKIDLSSHRSIGLFILTIDLHYNVLSEKIATWDLNNDMPGAICMTFVLKFQQPESFGRVCFLGRLKIQCACVTLCRRVAHSIFMNHKHRDTHRVFLSVNCQSRVQYNKLPHMFVVTGHQNFVLHWIV